MKQFLILFLSVITLASCSFTSGSGNIVTENRTVEPFDEIVVGGSFDVEVRIGPNAELKVEADDNVLKYIKTTVSGNSLKIRTENNHGFSNVHMKVYITTASVKV